MDLHPTCRRCKKNFAPTQTNSGSWKVICPDCSGGPKPHIDHAVDERMRLRTYSHRLLDGFTMLSEEDN